MKLTCISSLILSHVMVNYALPVQLNRNSASLADYLNYEDEEILGKSCNASCYEKLINAECDQTTNICQCVFDFPVILSASFGCVKPSSLGEQCMYSESCSYNDPFSTCLQISHNAYCGCVEGYHEVPIQRQNKKAFCSKDILPVENNASAFFIVIGGVVVFSTLIGFAFKLFVGKSRRRESTTINTRLLTTADIAQMARTFRQSNQNRNFSRRGSRGVTVSTSRAAAARAAAILLVSHNVPQSESLRRHSDSREITPTIPSRDSSCNSPKSFSAKQFKRESDRRLAKSRQHSRQQLSTPSLKQTSPK